MDNEHHTLTALPLRNSPATRFTGGWVVYSACQDGFGKWKIFTATKFRTLNYVARSESLYRPCYHIRKWRVYVSFLIQIYVRNIEDLVVNGEEIIRTHFLGIIFNQFYDFLQFIFFLCDKHDKV